MEPIANATNAQFLPEENGTYAALIMTGACNVLTDCYDYLYLGISEQDHGNTKVYPNPARDFILIDHWELADLKLMDLSGKILRFGKSDQPLDLVGLSQGNYLLLIEGEQSREVYPILVY